MDSPKRWHERANLWLTIGSLLIAVLSIWIQLRTKTRELTCNIISSSELTAISQIPSLTSAFTYKGKPIVHLWKVSLLFVNSGNETLVAEGPHSTLVGDGITLGFTNQVDIVNVEPSDNAHILKIEQPSTNTFKLKFSQWLAEEKASIVLYIASSGDYSQPLMPVSISRDILDGRIIVRNASLTLSSKASSAIERFPAILRIPTKIVGAILGLFSITLGLLVPTISNWHFFRRSQWKRKYSGAFFLYLKSLSSLPHSVDFYMRKPEMLPTEMWKDFKGEKLILNSFFDFDFDSWGQGFAVSLFMVVLGSLGAVYLISTVADFFPKLAAHFWT
jgi:hypothetical protein